MLPELHIPPRAKAPEEAEDSVVEAPEAEEEEAVLAASRSLYYVKSKTDRKSGLEAALYLNEIIT